MYKKPSKSVTRRDIRDCILLAKDRAITDLHDVLVNEGDRFMQLPAAKRRELQKRVLKIAKLLQLPDDDVKSFKPLCESYLNPDEDYATGE